MRTVEIHEAEETLSQLVDAALAGEKVILARAGKPVAELVRVQPRRGIRLGVLKGMFPDKFQADAVRPLSKRELERLFGTEVEP